MSSINTIFFDVGGVLLTNGWDHNARKLAAEKFNLPLSEFEAAHELYADPLDMGLISVNTYLEKVLFDKERNFSKFDFYEFMKSQSIPDHATISIAARLAQQNKHLLATLNNESTDLNLYRIEKFQLGPIFKMFLSSCYMGVKKPDPAIFIRALLISNRRPEETIFIDDRLENLDAPRQLGMSVIHFQGADKLEADLAALGLFT